jgi:hypothetical protein
MCLAYGRDRGEEDIEPRTVGSIEEWLDKGGQEYNYLWDGKEWLVDCGYTNQEKLIRLMPSRECRMMNVANLLEHFAKEREQE